MEPKIKSYQGVKILLGLYSVYIITFMALMVYSMSLTTGNVSNISVVPVLFLFGFASIILLYSLIKSGGKRFGKVLHGWSVFRLCFAPIAAISVWFMAGTTYGYTPSAIDKAFFISTFTITPLISIYLIFSLSGATLSSIGKALTKKI